MSDLKSGLMACADLWTEAHGNAPFSRLGKAVAGDANFFARLSAPNASLHLTTLEKFAVYLGDADNWPNETVPAEVIAFVRRVEGCPVSHSVDDGALSRGRSTVEIPEKSSGVAA